MTTPITTDEKSAEEIEAELESLLQEITQDNKAFEIDSSEMIAAIKTGLDTSNKHLDDLEDAGKKFEDEEGDKIDENILTQLAESEKLQSEE